MEKHLFVSDFDGYELLDSGDHMKLERFGAVILSRPDTQALWKKAKPELWETADAHFAWTGGKGAWRATKELPEVWDVRCKEMTLGAKLTNFKHTGIFPEQEPNWAWSRERVKALGTPKVLNLFGYTGAASIIAAQAGAAVTHVDSSKASLLWTRENAARSGLSENAITLIHEDARKFVKREVKRGARYDGIILDPPAFGRGAKDEVWKIEEDLGALMDELAALLSETSGAFFLINGYAAGYAPLSFNQLLMSAFPEAKTEFGELRIPESKSERALAEGIYARFTR